MIRTVADDFETATPSTEDCSQVKDAVRSTPRKEYVKGEPSDLVNLDLLRAVAVSLVFTGHLAACMRIRGLGDIGHFGVLLFFVHTAFVLMLSMERLGLNGDKLYTVFIVRRLFRIYPLSVLAVLLVVTFHIPAAPWLGEFVRLGWPRLLSNFLLVQNITHSESVLCVLWSLPFEMQMYAFLPILYILIRHFPSLWTISLIWMAGVVIAGLEYFVRIGKVDDEFLFFRYFPCFLAGVLAWQLMARRRYRVTGALWVLALMTLVVLYRLEDAVRVYGPNWQGILHGALRNDHRIWLPPSLDLVRDWVFCGVTGLALPFFADIKYHGLNMITKNIAQYSYGTYLCHVPMLWICFSLLHFGNIFASAILTLLLTVLVSYTLYHFIEHPWIQFGKHLSTLLVSGTALNLKVKS